MVGLFSAGSTRANNPTPPATSARVQSAVYGKPMPIGWGRFRVAGNIIWYGDFNSYTVPDSGGSGGKGGGGGGGKGSAAGGTTYYQAAVAIALCEGPVGAILGAWNNKTGDTLATLNLTPFAGSYSQAAWGYLETNHAAIAEQHVIPAAPPYTVQVDYNQPYLQDYGVTDANGNVYTPVASSPAAGQYAGGGGGLYIFNAADAGVAITIEYVAGNQQPQNEAVPYRGTAYVAAGPFALGTSPELPNLSFEVAGACSQRAVTTNWTIAAPYEVAIAAATDPAGNPYSQFVADGGVTDAAGDPFAAVAANPGHRQYVVTQGGAGATYGFWAGDAGTAVAIAFTASGQDACPADVVTDFLTNPDYGIGFPAGRLGSLATYASYCIASGLLVSPVLTDARAGNSFLADLMTGTNAEFVWSGGTLTIVPYGDSAIAANGASYSPPSAALYSLGDDDILAANQGSNPNSTSSAATPDPLMCTQLGADAQMNDVKVGWLDRSNQYNPAVAEAKDDAAINLYGLRATDLSQLGFFTSAVPAMLSAQLQLGRQAVRNSYVFTVGQQFILLDPMDVIEVTDPAMGLANAPVRVKEITENQDGSLNLLCEDYLAGIGTAPLYGSQATAGYQPNYNLAPPSSNAPVIFEPPAALTGGDLEVWLAASGPPGWAGCGVWLSSDGGTYSYAGTTVGPARQGVLTSALPAVTAAANPPTLDNADTLAVNLAESGGQLISGTQADAVAGNTVCYVDGELVGYTSAALVSGNAYDLTGLVRGMYGSAIAAHARGSQFARLDGTIFKLPFTADRIGGTIYIKLVPFNFWGGGAPSPAAVEPYAYTIRGTALAEDPGNVTGLCAAYVGGLTQLTWNPVSDPRSLDYELRLGTSWASGQVVGRTPLASAPILGDGTYWVAAHYAVPNGPDVYSPAPVSAVLSGTALVSNVIASRDQAGEGWGGQFVNAADSAGVLALGSQGDLLGTPDLLAAADLNAIDWLDQAADPSGDGVVYSGAYAIPATDKVDIGRPAPCNVMVTLGAVIGVNANAANWLAMADMLSASDLIGNDIGNHAWAVPQVRTSQDGFTWGAWQNWVPGSYSGRVFDCRVLLYSSDPAIATRLSDLVFAVDVPDRDDHYTGLVTNAGTGLVGQTFTPDGGASPAPFNGGPGESALPHVQITVTDAQPGDDPAQIVALSDAAITLRTTAGGSPVSRTLNVLAQGY